MNAVDKYELIIIGGGAAGMMAAISAARATKSDSINLLEKNEFLGRKVLATGNGRCNFSNAFCSWQDYGAGSHLHVQKAFNHLGPGDTVELFSELGILAKEEDEGRLYPYSSQASTLVNALVEELEYKKVKIRTSLEVSGIRKDRKHFIVEHKNGVFQSEKLIIATGGKAGLKYGSTGDGYGFAKNFGHSLIRPLPALVQVITEDAFSERLKGIRAKGAVTLKKGDSLIACEKGEIQFTDKGLSGICIFDLSRHLGENPAEYSIETDLFPEYSYGQVLQLLNDRKNKLNERTAESLLKGMLNSKLVPVYLDAAEIDIKQKAGEIEDVKLQKLAGILKSLKHNLKGTKGWVEAQVTKGGINSDEIHEDTLESKLVPGLYFAGEIMDVDGRCGGWNLQWAWSSGWMAGFHASKQP